MVGKHIWTLVGFAMAAVLPIASTAHAGTLTTPAIPNGSAASVSCVFVNAGAKAARDVRIEIRNGPTSVAAGLNQGVVEPGALTLTTDGNPSWFQHSYCVVSGRGVSRRASRVTLCNRESTATPRACVTTP